MTLWEKRWILVRSARSPRHARPLEPFCAWRGTGGGCRRRPHGRLPDGDAAEAEPTGDHAGCVRDVGAEAFAGVALEGCGGAVRGAAWGALGASELPGSRPGRAGGAGVLAR